MLGANEDSELAESNGDQVKCGWGIGSFFNYICLVYKMAYQ